MPELPDVTLYVEALAERLIGRQLERIVLRSPFVLRTVDPPVQAVAGRTVNAVRRLAKRIVMAFDGDFFVVVHLMRLGRFRWADRGKKAKHASGKVLLASFEFDAGTLHLVEMGPKKRAALHVVQGEAALAGFDPGGLEVATASAQAFAEALTRHNHTVKRALCDPRILAGIGNAYSDEILWEAQLSPVKLTQKLTEEELDALFRATQTSMRVWTEKLRRECNGAFPEHVTAFREDMAAHGRYGRPCPRCGAPIQRIVYADRETNYCAPCQTGGKPLADRGLSRLLGKDWPKTMEELEELREGAK